MFTFNCEYDMEGYLWFIPGKYSEYFAQSILYIQVNMLSAFMIKQKVIWILVKSIENQSHLIILQLWHDNNKNNKRNCFNDPAWESSGFCFVMV